MTERPIVGSWLGAFALLACSSASDGSGGNINRNDTAGGAGSLAVAASGSSGSSSIDVGSLSGGSGGGGGAEVMNGVCANQAFDLQRKPAELLIVLDRSASMKDPPSGTSGTSKWNLVVPGVNQVVTTTDSAVSWGLKVFPEGEGKECVAGSVTGAIPVPVAPANAKAVTAAVSATTPAGNGTPTGDAINAAVTYLKTLTDADPKFILLATDGEPSCAGTTKDVTLARASAVQAVAAAAAAGFKTFVIGVATTKNTATQALNDMAVAGQMPRMDPNPSANKFFLASTKDDLVTALQTITGQVSSCVFALTAQPPDPSNIAVHVNGMKAPQDTSHAAGWDYVSPDNMQIQVYGSWCDQIKSAAANQVNIVLGCPGQPPPK